jgi:hypothetical protein
MTFRNYQARDKEKWLELFHSSLLLRAKGFPNGVVNNQEKDNQHDE